MLRSMIPRWAALLGVLALLLSTVAFATPRTLAFEQGTVVATATWAPGQEPDEVVEVCFRVTSDLAGDDQLGVACSVDETYSVMFGPNDPDLQTGYPYYVWQVVDSGWEITGDNPVEVVIPDTTGEVTATFENRRIDGAWIEVHEFVCPAGFQSDDIEDYHEACHATPRVDVEMSASGPGDRFTIGKTDASGELLFAGYTESGEITVAESIPTGDYIGFVVGCTRMDTEAEVPIEYRTNGKASFAFDVTPEIADGDIGVLCEWYNIPPAPLEETASLTLHVSLCPVGVDPNDRFEQCHPYGLEGVDFSLDGPVQRNGSTAGHLGAVLWEELPAGIYTVVQQTVIEHVVAYDVYCSRTDTGEAVNVSLSDSGQPAVDVEIAAEAPVVCDWYNLTADAPTPTNTPSLEPALTIAPHRGHDGETVSFAGTGYTPGGSVSVLMTGDGLIVAETMADRDGSIAGTFRAPDRDRLTGESGNRIPVFAIDDATGQESNREYFVYVTTLPTATATPSPTPTPIVGRPVHLHQGVCGALDPDWSIGLTDLTTPVAGAAEIVLATVAEASYTVVDISLGELLDGDYAINAHPSREQMRPFVACGEIGGPIRADGSVVVGIREQNGSGLTGIAYLIPDPTDPDRTRISVFLAPGLAEEDPTLLPAADEIVIQSVVNNGPVSPEFQEGSVITIYADGRVEIVVTPQGASPAIPEDERTAEIETRSSTIQRDDLLDLLSALDEVGFYQITQADEVDPDDLLVGGDTSRLTVTLIDGVWEVDGNGLSGDEGSMLAAAQRAVAAAVGFAPAEPN
ncbi:MAG: hypothetical protein IT336_03070 [Thermomicrobiales bacterium]|nr:hypothetical protein [Thermomicrobiales bacterium]